MFKYDQYNPQEPGKTLEELGQEAEYPADFLGHSKRVVSEMQESSCSLVLALIAVASLMLASGLLHVCGLL